MLLAGVLLATLAAAPKPVPIYIYVGPMVRDGFVDIDRGVSDSVKDVRRRLHGKKGLALVKDERLADVALYVTKRGVGPPGGSGSTIHFPGQVLKWPNGDETHLPGTSLHIAVESRFVQAIARVGEYERPFIGHDADHGTWSRCAELIARDFTTWVTANRRRIRPE